MSSIAFGKGEYAYHIFLNNLRYSLKPIGLRFALGAHSFAELKNAFKTTFLTIFIFLSTYAMVERTRQISPLIVFYNNDVIPIVTDQNEKPENKVKILRKLEKKLTKHLGSKYIRWTYPYAKEELTMNALTNERVADHIGYIQSFMQTFIAQDTLKRRIMTTGSLSLGLLATLKTWFY